MTFTSPMWIKQEMICSCGNKFAPCYRNGILMFKKCPNCRLKSELKTQHTYSTVSKGKIGHSPQKRQKTPRQKWMDNADTWFSRYVRIVNRVTTVNGDVICRDIITGKLYSANKIDNGHYWSRDCKATRYEPNNCRPQNKSSNQYRGEADKDKFMDNLIAEIGEEEYTRIDKLHRLLVNDSAEWYKEQSDKYRRLVNEEIKKYGLNKWW